MWPLAFLAAVVITLFVTPSHAYVSSIVADDFVVIGEPFSLTLWLTTDNGVTRDFGVAVGIAPVSGSDWDDCQWCTYLPLLYIDLLDNATAPTGSNASSVTYSIPTDGSGNISGGRVPATETQYKLQVSDYYLDITSGQTGRFFYSAPIFVSESG